MAHYRVQMVLDFAVSRSGRPGRVEACGSVLGSDPIECASTYNPAILRDHVDVLVLDANDVEALQRAPRWRVRRRQQRRSSQRQAVNLLRLALARRDE